MSSSQELNINTIPIFDGSNFFEWEAQMTGYFQVRNLWRLVNGTRTLPVAGATQADVDAWLDTDEMARGLLTLKIAFNLRAGQVDTTVAQTWTNVTTNFGRTSVAAIYQDFKAAMRMRVGTGNPARDITKLYTHLQRLVANQVVIPLY